MAVIIDGQLQKELLCRLVGEYMTKVRSSTRGLTLILISNSAVYTPGVILRRGEL